MQAEIQIDAALFGSFEINDQGIIRHYQPVAADKDETGARAELVGRNFFNDVAPRGRAEELRARIRHFRRGGKPTETFDLDLGRPGEGLLTARVLLTTIQERTANETTESVLVHIRRA
ncbi:MAG TPA: hypothetical protein VF703_02830 [Pyrinomonadaceae bacterium]|jgi:hypothetical protein